MDNSSVCSRSARKYTLTSECLDCHHAVVKQAENFSVRDFEKKIKSHLHREAFQADLQQNNVYIPFSDDAKAMARGMDPQGMSLTGGGGLARVPNLCVCKQLFDWAWHPQGTSCRGGV